MIKVGGFFFSLAKVLFCFHLKELSGFVLRFAVSTIFLKLNKTFNVHTFNEWMNFLRKKKTTVATLNSLQNANSIQWLYSYQLRENRLNAAHCFFIRPTKLIINYILIYKSDNILLLFFLHLYFKFIWTLICLNVNCQCLLFFVTFQLEP